MLDKFITEIVREKKGLSPEALEELSQRGNGKSLFNFLVQKEWMTEEELLSALGAKLRVPYWKDLEAQGLDPSLISKVPIAFSKKHKIVPIKVEEGILTVAAVDPLNYEPLDDLLLILGGQEIRTLKASLLHLVLAVRCRP